MEKNNTNLSSRRNQTLNIDWDCIFRDLIKNWWMILVAAIGSGLLISAVIMLRYTPAYTSETVFVIGRSGFGYNSLSANLSQAETTTKQYTQVVNSSILRKKVCEDLGKNSFNATLSVETVPSSNLMVLRVTASSSRDAYIIAKSVVTNAVDLMGHFMNNVTMRQLQQATIAENPSNPLNILSYVEKAVPAGAILMIIILGLLSYFRDTVKNADDVTTKIDTRLIGTIDFEKKRRSLAAKLANKKGSLLLTNPMLSFSYVESYHMLAMRVRLSMSKHAQKVLMLCSVSENEGKSTAAANIAVSLAQEGKKVLLIDCDFRKPSQYKIFESGKQIDNLDFSETIRTKGSLKVGTSKEIPGLYTLFSKTPVNHAWNSEQFEYLAQVINYVKPKVDYIILDTSPMALVSDTEEYAALADAAVLVIRQDVMEACYINDAIDNLERTGIRLLGCVLNGVRKGLISKTKEYGHYGGNYYGKYSHYSNVRK